MSWRDCTVGEVVRLKRGHDLPDQDRKPGDVPVVGSAGPNGWHNEARVKGPGVSLGRSGASIGKVTYTSTDYWPHNACLYVTDFLGNVPRFVYYYLRTKDFRSLNSGAAQPSLNRNFVHVVPARIPGPQEQATIANVLSAYDDLIENNRRRVALLEEAAQLLHREWFVHFRFPGHEHVKIVDALPEGWERCPIGDFVELKYGKALKEGDRKEGPFPVYGSSGIVGTHQTALVEAPSIVVGRKGNVGSVYWAPVNFWPIDTVYFIPKEQVDYWLYLSLPSAGFQNTDSGVPGLNREFAYSRKLTRPSDRLRRLFNETVEPFFIQRTTLENYSRKLAQARDVLLPRMMNGEIPV